MDYDTFDCPGWLSTTLAQRIQGLSVCGHSRGSVNVQVEAPESTSSVVDAIFDDIRAGRNAGLGSPVLSATDQNGQTVTPASSSFQWWWVVAGVGGAILVAVVVVATVLLVRRHRSGSFHRSYHSSHSYVPLGQK